MKIGEGHDWANGSGSVTGVDADGFGVPALRPLRRLGAAGAVAVRARGNKDLGVMSVDAFIELITKDITAKA